MAEVKWLPDGYSSVTPYLVVKGAAQAIDYYKKVFGAEELFRMPAPDGKIGHAEIKIGNSPIMLADEHPEMGHLGPLSIGGAPVGLVLYVEDVDTVFNLAIKEGAKEQKPLKDELYGDRMGALVDPFGHVWHVATHKEDVSPEEMQKRMEAASGASA